MTEFDDVKSCKSIEELNEFIQKYLDGHNLKGENRRKTYWALFYAWKEKTGLANE